MDISDLNISATGDATEVPAWMTDHKVLKDAYKTDEDKHPFPCPLSPCSDHQPEPHPEIVELLVEPNNFPKFRPTWDSESPLLRYQTITFMPEYSTLSLEELRWNDIQNPLLPPPLKSRGLFSSQSGIIFRKKPKTFGDTQYTVKQPPYPNLVEIDMESILSRVSTPPVPPERLIDDAALMGALKTLTLQTVPLPDPHLERCGITLTNPKMYCRPNPKILDLLTKGGQCLVWNFTVGHYGFGTCTFPGQMDVYGANIDEIFQFSETEGVKIYKNGPTPSFGHGFHRPAIVIWKVRSNQNNNKNKDLTQFVPLLKKYCKKHESCWKFVSFKIDNQLEIWTFKIQLSPNSKSDDTLDILIKHIISNYYDKC